MLGFLFFCGWCQKWGRFRSLWPKLSGPGVLWAFDWLSSITGSKVMAKKT